MSWLLDYTIKKATDIPYVQGQRRVYSVITDKKGNILSEGQNSYTKTHPLQAFYANKVDLPDKVFLHAEMSAMVKVRQGDPYKIYVARVDADGNPMVAAPCPICYTAIQESGIQVVEHTV